MVDRFSVLSWMGEKKNRMVKEKKVKVKKKKGMEEKRENIHNWE